MAIISCPECSKEISDQAAACPSCGFPIKKAPLSTSKPKMIWLKEENNFIIIQCPSCKKISNIKTTTAAIESASGYKLVGEGTCTCGVVFDEILKDNEVRCPNCGSKEFSVQKEGFDAGSACCGAFLVGPLGLLCGAKEANKLNRHCLKCGYKWEVGK